MVLRLGVNALSGDKVAVAAPGPQRPLLGRSARALRWFGPPGMNSTDPPREPCKAMTILSNITLMVSPSFPRVLIVAPLR